MRLGLTLLAAGLSLAPLTSWAQNADIAKVCEEVKDPLYFPINETTNKLIVPPGLDRDQSARFSLALLYRAGIFANIRKLQVAREAEAQLNQIELGLDNPSPNATAALEQIRRGLQQQAKRAEEEGRADKENFDLQFKALCENIQPPTTITLQPIPGLFPGRVALAAPLPPVRPPTPPAAGLRYVLAETKPSQGHASLTVSDGRVFADGGYFNIETTWTKPPQSFGPEGFTVSLTCKVTPPPQQNLASNLDVRGGFLFDPSIPQFDCQALNGKVLTLTKEVAVKPMPSQTDGDVWVQIGGGGGGVAYRYRIEK